MERLSGSKECVMRECAAEAAAVLAGTTAAVVAGLFNFAWRRIVYKPDKTERRSYIIQSSETL